MTIKIKEIQEYDLLAETNRLLDRSLLTPTQINYLTGLSKPWIAQMKRGGIANPSYKFLTALRDVLKKAEDAGICKKD